MRHKSKVLNPDFSSLLSQDFQNTQPYIELASGTEGEVNYEAVGYQGKSCDSAASDLIKAIEGEEGDSRKNKSTYSQVKFGQSSGQSSTAKKQNHLKA